MDNDSLVPILVVDDQPENLLTLKAIFSRMPLNIVTATSGAEALRHLMNRSFAVILMDASMPIMDGFEASRAIRSREKTRHIPIIFLTAAHADSHHAGSGYDLGAVDYLYKPPDPDALRAKVAVFMDLYRKSEELIQTKAELEEKLSTLKSLNQELQKLAAIVECSSDAILSKDLNGTVQSWNHAAELMFGYSAAEMIGLRTIALYPSDRIAEVHELQSRLRSNERIEQFETVRVAKDGRLIDISLSIFPVKDEHGKTVALAEIARDISEKKAFEDAMLESKRELELLTDALMVAKEQALSASRLKSEFVANMSHEIRTPMNGIIGMCDALMRTNLTDKQKECATAINEAGKTLLSIVNDVLDFSKIEAGKTELELVEFDSVSLIEGVCQLFSVQTKSKELSLLSYVDISVPRLLKGDPERLRQVLTNLIGNAVKFTFSGEVVVKASAIPLGDMNSEVRFEVIDSGIGIDEEEQRRLFQPFVQADGSINKKFGGTGLGLSITKNLIELMGGSIGVTSTKGEGSTFWCTVPFENAGAPLILSVADELRGSSVLVVDDEPYSRAILTDYINSWGIKAVAASSGQEALSLLSDAARNGKPFSIAIIDMAMPEMDGLTLAKRIKHDNTLKLMKLILLNGPVDVEQQFRELGFSAYLKKPVKQSHLLDCITELVVGKRAVELLAQTSLEHFDEGIVLIADDYSINRQVLQMYLDHLGLQYHTAVDGQEVLERLSRTSYNLILMDCQMPVLDGFAATKIIRKQEASNGNYTPIIALTAYAMEGDRERCLSAGMDDYITKPIELLKLEGVLRKWLPQTKNHSGDEQKPIFNVSKLEARFSRTDSCALIEAFFNEIDLKAQLIEKAVSNQTPRELSNLMHGIRGVSGVLCVEQLQDVCVRIEKIAAADDWNQIVGLIDKFNSCLNETKMAMRHYVEIDDDNSGNGS